MLSAMLALRDVAKRSHPSLRFGQAVCNEFNLINPELYFTGDDDKAEALIKEMAEQYQW
jgi:hypothetical protein